MNLTQHDALPFPADEALPLTTACAHEHLPYAVLRRVVVNGVVRGAKAGRIWYVHLPSLRAFARRYHAAVRATSDLARLTRQPLGGSPEAA